MTFNNNNRYFSAIANANHWSPMGGYTWSPNVIVTGTNGQVTNGAWVPLQSDANGNLQVNLNNAVVSGSFTVDNTVVVNAINSGTVATNQVVATLQAGIIAIDTGIRAVNITNSAPIAVSGNLVSTIPTYNKISSTGYAQNFSPFASTQLIRGIQGYSKCGLGNGFGGSIQIFDGSTLVTTLAANSGSNFFMDFAENGVTFNNLIISNSSDPIVSTPYGVADFFVTVIYR